MGRDDNAYRNQTTDEIQIGDCEKHCTDLAYPR
jgi:hypothetical protein